MTTEELPANQEFDFGGDSEVETVEAVFTITEAEEKDTDSANGTGKQHVLTFESEAWPYPITMRQFVEYTPTDSSKGIEWVTRSRGVLKKIAKAALGSTGYSLNPSSPNYIVGRAVKATTKDNGEGFATLSRFKSVE